VKLSGSQSFGGLVELVASPLSSRNLNDNIPAASPKRLHCPREISSSSEVSSIHKLNQFTLFFLVFMHVTRSNINPKVNFIRFACKVSRSRNKSFLLKLDLVKVPIFRQFSLHLKLVKGVVLKGSVLRSLTSLKCFLCCPITTS